MINDGFCWENSLRKCQYLYKNVKVLKSWGKNRENSADFCPGKSGKNPFKIRRFLKSKKSRTLFPE